MLPIICLLLLPFVCLADDIDDASAQISISTDAALQSINKTDDGTLHIQHTFEAERTYGINITTLEACEEWREYWALSANETYEEEEGARPPSSYVVTTAIQAEEIGLDPSLLDQFTNISIITETVCGGFAEIYWLNDSSLANTSIGLSGIAEEFFCKPFEILFTPTRAMFLTWRDRRRDMATERSSNATIGDDGDEYMRSVLDILEEELRSNSTFVMAVPAVEGEEVTEAPSTSNETLTELETVATAFELDLTDETKPILYINNNVALMALNLAPTDAFDRYPRIGLQMRAVCSHVLSTRKDDANDRALLGDDVIGGISDNVYVNEKELAALLKNDTRVDDIFALYAEQPSSLGASYIESLFANSSYDPNTAPSYFVGQPVIVRIGIFISSLSNFETSTMDYNMDIYLKMAWRDFRLTHNYSAPILLKTEEYLERVWRPDPYFGNTKDSDWHDVTVPNQLMRIYQKGEVYYEQRLKLNPSCNLVLCKYPHDLQRCALHIGSYAYPEAELRFEWFTEKKQAVELSSAVKLPDLYIEGIERHRCNGYRFGGNFTCLSAVFDLRRDVGYHIAQTYVPTSLALMFSWVSVWMPDDLMEGRIAVAITVLLTMSTESAGARANLPMVSYLKAIDIWFGFFSAFVFLTLLQTLVVMALLKSSANLQKWATKKSDFITQEQRIYMLKRSDSHRQHARLCDSVCRVAYPFIFCVFLMLYFFQFTQGAQDSCISERS